MKSFKAIKRRLQLSMGCFLISASTVILTAVLGDNSGGFLVGILFWLGMAGGIAAYAVMLKRCDKDILEQIPRRKAPPGLNFFSNRAAIIIDTMWVITCGVMIYAMLSLKVNQVLETICLFLFVSATYGHFIVNGKMVCLLLQREKGGKKNGKDM